jgi:hypothetical protein
LGAELGRECDGDQPAGIGEGGEERGATDFRWCLERREIAALRRRLHRPAVDALGGAGFGNDHFFQQRQLRLELFPNPERDIFAGRIFQAGNFVEIIMIKLFPKWFEGVADVGVVHDPSEFFVARPFDRDFDFETVTVQTAAFVRLRQIGQEMRGFELKCFPEFH